jgi:hypothetical protein
MGHGIDAIDRLLSSMAGLSDVATDGRSSLVVTKVIGAASSSRSPKKEA